MSSTKQKSKKKAAIFPLKGLVIFMVGLIALASVILWSSLFKSYPIEGKKQMLAIGAGDTYSGFIDRLAKEDKISFPIILKCVKSWRCCRILKMHK